MPGPFNIASQLPYKFPKQIQNLLKSKPSKYNIIYSLDNQNQLGVTLLKRNHLINGSRFEEFDPQTQQEPYAAAVFNWYYNYYTSFINDKKLHDRVKNINPLITSRLPLKLFFQHINALQKIDPLSVDHQIPYNLLSWAISALYHQTEPFKNRYSGFFTFEWHQFDLLAKLITDNSDTIPDYHRFRMKMFPHILNEEVPALVKQFQYITDIEKLYQHKVYGDTYTYPFSDLFNKDPNLRETICDLIIETERNLYVEGNLKQAGNLQKQLQAILKQNKLILDCPKIQFFCHTVNDYHSLQFLQERIAKLRAIRTLPATDIEKNRALGLIGDIGEYCCNRKLSKSMREKLLSFIPLQEFIQLRDAIEHQDERGWHNLINSWLQEGFAGDGVTWKSLMHCYTLLEFHITQILNNKYTNPDEYFLKLYEYESNRENTLSAPKFLKEHLKYLDQDEDEATIEFYNKVREGTLVLSPLNIAELYSLREATPPGEDKRVEAIDNFLKLHRHHWNQRKKLWLQSLPVSEKDIKKYIAIVEKLPNSQLWIDALSNRKLLPDLETRRELANDYLSPSNRADFIRITLLLSVEHLDFHPLYCLAQKFKDAKGASFSRIQIINHAEQLLKKLYDVTMHEYIFHPMFSTSVSRKNDKKDLITLYQNTREACYAQLKNNTTFKDEINYHLRYGLILLKKIMKYPESALNIELVQFNKFFSICFKLRKVRNILAHGDYTLAIIDRANPNNPAQHDFIVEGIMSIPEILVELNRIKAQIVECDKICLKAKELVQERAMRYIAQSNYEIMPHELAHILAKRNRRLDYLEAPLKEGHSMAYIEMRRRAERAIKFCKNSNGI